MTRTTLDLDPTVLKLLKEKAKQEGKSMGQVASEELLPALRDAGRSDDGPLRWISRDLGEPRVDLEDKEALWKILDER